MTLSLEKDDEFSEHGPNAHNMYSVELRPNSGRLGITLSGSEEPFDPILIAAIESGSVADRSASLWLFLTHPKYSRYF